MSGGYADRLIQDVDYGLCGDREWVSSERTVQQQLNRMVDHIKQSERVVIMTGAGISTTCGIPDFRGQRGVWTLKLAEETPTTSDIGVPFEMATPTRAHMGVVSLVRAGAVCGVITQNVDGLHRRSGLEGKSLIELHGNIFQEDCKKCHNSWWRTVDVGGVGCKPTGRICPDCGGPLVDFVIDWDTDLPGKELCRAQRLCDSADTLVCLGTSLRIDPVGKFPLRTLKSGGEVFVVNYQKTPISRRKGVTSIHCSTDYAIHHWIQAVGLQYVPYSPIHRLRVSVDISDRERPPDQGADAGATGHTTDCPQRVVLQGLDVGFPPSPCITSASLCPDGTQGVQQEHVFHHDDDVDGTWVLSGVPLSVLSEASLQFEFRNGLGGVDTTAMVQSGDMIDVRERPVQFNVNDVVSPTSLVRGGVPPGKRRRVGS